MASNVDKLSKFNSAINHYAESQREKILKDIADYQARELEETANNAKIEADRLLVKELAEMRVALCVKCPIVRWVSLQRIAYLNAKKFLKKYSRELKKL